MRSVRFLVLGVIVSLELSAYASGQEASVLAIIGETVLDVRTGKKTANSTILVEGDTIKEVGPHEPASDSDRHGQCCVALGQEETLGTVEPGRWADLLIVDGDPLTDIKNIKKIRWVIQSGRIYEPTQLLNRKES